MLLKIDNQVVPLFDNADNAFTGSADQCQFKYNGGTAISPYYKFNADRLGNLCLSQSLFDKMSQRNDPRIAKYFSDTKKLAPNRKPDQDQTRYGTSNLSSPTAPTFLISYHELEFLKAEAYARLGKPDEAKSALQSAITAAFAKVGLTTANATAYYQSLQSFLGTDPLREIMIQKYLAFYEEESMEAYNDYRRMKALNENFIELKNSNNPSKFPLRYAHGASDVTANLNVNTAYGDGSYVYTEPVWWAGGNR